MKKILFILFLLFIANDYLRAEESQNLSSNNLENATESNDLNQDENLVIIGTTKPENVSPSFYDLKHEIGAFYFNTFGLSNPERLGVNGGGVSYTIPIKMGKFRAKPFVRISYGRATSISLNRDLRASNFYSWQLGASSSVSLQNAAIQAHLLYGIDFGGSYRTNLGENLENGTKIYSINTFIGADFLYKQFVFTPIFRVYSYFISDSAIPNITGLYTDLGFRAAYLFRKVDAYIELDYRQDFMRANSESFIILPNNKGMFLGSNASSLEGSANIEVDSFKNFKVRASAGVLYTVQYYNVNVYVELEAKLIF